MSSTSDKCPTCHRAIPGRKRIIDYHKIMALHLAGLSLRAIAKQLGINHNTVRNAILANKALTF